MKRDMFASIKIRIYGLNGDLMDNREDWTNKDREDLNKYINSLEPLLEKELPNITQEKEERINIVIGKMNKRLSSLYENILTSEEYGGYSTKMIAHLLKETYERLYKEVIK